MKIHTSLWMLKFQEKISEPKVSRLLPNVCDFQKKTNTLKKFKNLKKIYRLAYGFLCFVISISEGCRKKQMLEFLDKRVYDDGGCEDGPC
jgi:hypothetical protein